MEWLEPCLTWDALFAFLSLTGLEIVLGIDNIIFIAILADRLPPAKRDFARKMGLMIAVVSRLILLMGIGYVVKLKSPLFSLFEHPFTGKDLILLFGGLFLVAKATHEIHKKVEGHADHEGGSKAPATMASMLFQVFIMDVIFSLDSVITAVGMTSLVPVMVSAVLVSVAIMLIFSGYVVDFVARHPATKLLALSFLLMIGVLLLGEAFHYEIPKGYIYFSMAFSLMIELLQMRAEKKASRAHAIEVPTPDH
jgi:predicted tellurium resistance membrane protein TerC